MIGSNCPWKAQIRFKDLWRKKDGETNFVNESCSSWRSRSTTMSVEISQPTLLLLTCGWSFFGYKTLAGSGFYILQHGTHSNSFFLLGLGRTFMISIALSIANSCWFLIVIAILYSSSSTGMSQFCKLSIGFWCSEQTSPSSWGVLFKGSNVLVVDDMESFN